MTQRAAQKSLLGLLDVFCLLVSPLAIIFFIFVMIVVADELGQHVQMLRDLDQYGQVAEGEWHPADEGDKYASVWIPTGKLNSLGYPDYDIQLINVRYYAPRRLAELKVGQPVRVRYVDQYGHETHAVLEDDYANIRRWPGFLTDYIWLILIPWVVIIIHPDFLYLGLVKDPFAALP